MNLSGVESVGGDKGGEKKLFFKINFLTRSACTLYFSVPVDLYTVFSDPKTLVKNLAKNLVKIVPKISPLVSPDQFFGRQAPKSTDSTPVQVNDL